MAQRSALQRFVNAHRRALGMTRGPATSTRRPAHVMVLEDQPFFSQLLSVILASGGYEATVVREGQALLDAVERRKPDVVVLDIDVPDIDGLQVLARLRRNFDSDALPIMMASARGELNFPMRAKALGANLFLRKPYSISQIFERVEHLLARKRVPADELLI